MANTTWNTSDKVNVTLGGTNSLTATATAAGGVRSIDRVASGKFYWEYTVSTWGGSSTCVGIANVNAALATVASTPIAACAVYKGGTIFRDNVNTGSTLGALVSGSIIGIALDRTARLIWFRLCPSGNWNGNASADPAAGIGGLALNTVAAASPFLSTYALIGFAGAGDVVTANFGDAAFSGAVPNTFTSGFTAGLGPTLNAITTQVAFEEWVSNPFVPGIAQVTQVSFSQWITTVPQAQLTQLAIEEWSSNTSALGQALMTIIAVEEWAQVIKDVPPVKPYAMILA